MSRSNNIFQSIALGLLMVSGPIAPKHAVGEHGNQYAE